MQQDDESGSLDFLMEISATPEKIMWESAPQSHREGGK